MQIVFYEFKLKKMIQSWVGRKWGWVWEVWGKYKQIHHMKFLYN